MSSDMTNTLMQMLLNQKLSERAAAVEEQRDARKFIFDQRAEIAKEERQHRRKLEFEQAKARLKAAEAGNTLSSDLLGAGEVSAAGQVNRAQSEAVTSAGAGDAQGVVDAFRRAEAVGGEDFVRGLNLTAANEQAGKDQRTIRGEQRSERRKIASERRGERRLIERPVRQLRLMASALEDAKAAGDVTEATRLQGLIDKKTSGDDFNIEVGPDGRIIGISKGSAGTAAQRVKLTNQLISARRDAALLDRVAETVLTHEVGAAGGLKDAAGNLVAVVQDLSNMVAGGVDLGLTSELEDELMALQSGSVAEIAGLRLDEFAVAYVGARTSRARDGSRLSATELKEWLKRSGLVGGLDSRRRVAGRVRNIRNRSRRRLRDISSQAESMGIVLPEAEPLSSDPLDQQLRDMGQGTGALRGGQDRDVPAGLRDKLNSTSDEAVLEAFGDG